MTLSWNNHTFYCWTDASWKTTFASKLESESWSVKTWLKDVLLQNWLTLCTPFDKYLELEKKYISDSIVNLIFDRCSIDFLVYHVLMENLWNDMWKIINLLETQHQEYLHNFIEVNSKSSLIYLTTSFDVMKKRMLSRDSLSKFDRLLLDSSATFEMYKEIFEQIIVALNRINNQVPPMNRMSIIKSDTSIDLLS